MIVNFAKMHGLGNDFVVIDLITQGARLSQAHLIRIADRKLGVGCDQIILVTPPSQAKSDFYYKIFNADGSEAEQCINGLRCAARFVADMGLTNKQQLIADCLGGTSHIELHENLVTASWHKNFNEITALNIAYPGLSPLIHSLSIGNPHGVLVVDAIDNYQVKVLGNKLSRNPIFPQGANIGFMQIIDRNQIKLRVFERGSGLTLACGSGACAAALVGNSLNLLDDKVEVMFKHGSLTIQLDRSADKISVTGPAVSVYIGRFRI